MNSCLCPSHHLLFSRGDHSTNCSQQQSQLTAAMDDLDGLLDWIDQVGAHHRKLQQLHLAKTRALDQDRDILNFKTKLRKQIVDDEFTKLGQVLADGLSDGLIDEDGSKMFESPKEPNEEELDVDDAELDLESTLQDVHNSQSLSEEADLPADYEEQEDLEVEIVEVISGSDTENDDDHSAEDNGEEDLTVEPELDDFYDVENEFDDVDDLDRFEMHDSAADYDTAQDLEAQLVNALMGQIANDQTTNDVETMTGNDAIHNDEFLNNIDIEEDEDLEEEEGFEQDESIDNELIEDDVVEDDVVEDDEFAEHDQFANNDEGINDAATSVEDDENSEDLSKQSLSVHPTSAKQRESTATEKQGLPSFADEPLIVELESYDAEESNSLAAASLAWLANAAIDASLNNNAPLRNSDYAADVELTATDNGGTDGVFDGLEEPPVALAEGVEVPVLLTNGNGQGLPITLKSQPVIEDNQTEGSLADEEREGLSEWLKKELKLAEADSVDVVLSEAELEVSHEPQPVNEPTSTRLSFSYLPPTPPSIFVHPITNPEVDHPKPIFRTVKEEPIETLRKLRHAQASSNITLKVLRQLEEELGVDSTNLAAMKSATKRACNDLESMGLEDITGDILSRLEQEFGEIRKPILEPISDEDEDEDEDADEDMNNDEDIDEAESIKAVEPEEIDDIDTIDQVPAILEPIESDDEVLIEYAHDTIVQLTTMVSPLIIEEAEELTFTERSDLIEEITEATSGVQSPLIPLDILEVDEATEVLVILDENQELASQFDAIAPTLVVEFDEEEFANDNINIDHNMEVSEIKSEPSRKRAWTKIYGSIVDVPRKLFKKAFDEARFSGKLIDATVDDISEAVVDAAGDMIQNIGDSLQAAEKIVEEVEQVEVDDVATTTGEVLQSIEDVVHEANEIEVNDPAKAVSEFIQTVESAISAAQQVEVDEVIGSGDAMNVAEDVDEVNDVKAVATGIPSKFSPSVDSIANNPIDDNEGKDVFIADLPEVFYLEESESDLNVIHSSEPELKANDIEVPILDSVEGLDESTSDAELTILQLPEAKNIANLEDPNQTEDTNDQESCQIRDFHRSKLGGDGEDNADVSLNTSVATLLKEAVDEANTKPLQSDEDEVNEADSSFSERGHNSESVIDIDAIVDNEGDDGNISDANGDDALNENVTTGKFNVDNESTEQSRLSETSTPEAADINNLIRPDVSMSTERHDICAEHTFEPDDVIDLLVDNITGGVEDDSMVDERDTSNVVRTESMQNRDAILMDESASTVDQLSSAAEFVSDLRQRFDDNADQFEESKNVDVVENDEFTERDVTKIAVPSTTTVEIHKPENKNSTSALQSIIDAFEVEEQTIFADINDISEDAHDKKLEAGNEIEHNDDEEDSNYCEGSSPSGDQTLLDVVTAALISNSQGLASDDTSSGDDKEIDLDDDEAGSESPPYTTAITPPILEPIDDSSGSDEEFVAEESFPRAQLMIGNITVDAMEFVDEDEDDDDYDEIDEVEVHDNEELDENADNSYIEFESHEILESARNIDSENADVKLEDLDGNENDIAVDDMRANEMLSEELELNDSDDSEVTEDESADETVNERYRDLQQIQRTLEYSLAACERTLDENIRLNEELRAEYDANISPTQIESTVPGEFEADTSLGEIGVQGKLAKAEPNERLDKIDHGVPEVAPQPHKSPVSKKTFPGPDHEHELDDPNLDDVPPENLPHIKARVLGLDIDERLLGELEPQRLLRSGHRFGQVYSEEPIVEQLRHIDGALIEEPLNKDEKNPITISEPRRSQRTPKKEKTKKPLSAFEAVTKAASQGHSVYEDQKEDQTQSLEVPKIRVTRRGRLSRVLSAEHHDRQLSDGPSLRTRLKLPVKFELDPLSPTEGALEKPLDSIDLKPEPEADNLPSADKSQRNPRKRAHDSMKSALGSRRSRRTRRKS